MIEQRKHQRIRFSEPPRVRIGFAGRITEGSLENLSISGLMLRTDLPLTAHGVAGCEFSLCGSPVADVSVSVLNCLGDLYGARFRSGLINPVLIEDAMRDAKGQVDEVQQRLSLPRKTLYDRLTKYGLRAKDYRR